MHLKYRDSEPHPSVVSGPSPEAGAPDIEITPAMIAAGAAVLRVWDRRIEDDEALCEAIFVEMLRGSHSQA
jgi:hypothetical protein